MTWALVRPLYAQGIEFFFHLLIAGDRKIFTCKIVITIKITNNMSSYSLIKLPRCHTLSVGDIFTDKPQNRETLLIK